LITTVIHPFLITDSICLLTQADALPAQIERCEWGMADGLSIERFALGASRQTIALPF